MCCVRGGWLLLGILCFFRSVVLMTPRRKIPSNVCVKPFKTKRARLTESGGKGEGEKAGGKGAANQR